jgi:glutathione S-transferase
MSERKPTLWHIVISHYSEKARWALDYKSVEHERRAPLPGAHAVVALALTRGRHNTFPILRLDGRNVGDSSAIIAALEERYPEPRLYPEDAEDRRRALALEDWFDEELGPHIRLMMFHEALKAPDEFAEVVARMSPAPVARFKAGAGAYARAWARLRFGVGSADRAELGRTKVVEALDRLEAELGDDEYLVGDSFTVADLTAAALLYPIVQPPEGPSVIDRLPAGVERFREPLRQRPGYQWVEEMFRRHRDRGRALVGLA